MNSSRRGTKSADALYPARERGWFYGAFDKSGSWFSTGRSTLTEKGAQVDLLFDRADRVLTVCECKWATQLKGKSLVENFENKVKNLQMAFPGHGIQKVLVLGLDVPIPDAVQKYFDHILLAEKVFFKA